MNRLIRTGILGLAMVCTVSPPALAADDHKPKHGGIVVDAKTVDLEVVAKDGLIVIYASDHGTPMKITSASGKVTVFNGKDKVELPLVLVVDRLEAKGGFTVAAGTRVLTEVALNGKAAVAARVTLK